MSDGAIILGAWIVVVAILLLLAAARSRGG
jgi:hypothetical protein